MTAEVDRRTSRHLTTLTAALSQRARGRAGSCRCSRRSERPSRAILE